MFSKFQPIGSGSMIWLNANTSFRVGLWAIENIDVLIEDSEVSVEDDEWVPMLVESGEDGLSVWALVVWYGLVRRTGGCCEGGGGEEDISML